VWFYFNVSFSLRDKKMKRRTFLQSSLALGGTGVLPAFAQTLTESAYPAKLVKIIVPFPPGGATDVTARLIGQKLDELLKQRFVTDNKPGGGSNIGTVLAARAPADGYTLLLCTIANAVNMSLFKEPGYDFLKDFAPISILSKAPSILVTSPMLPVTSVKELIALAKAQPGKLSFASSSVGTMPHLGGEVFKDRFGLDITHIPYKGAAPALTDTISGVVSMGFITALSALPSIQAGKLRPLAVAASSRLALLPDVPTLSEAGVPDLELAGWFGLAAPAGTPAHIVELLSAACAKIPSMPGIQETFTAQAAECVSSTPANFTKFIQAEIDKWRSVIKLVGVEQV
jgi:tripartite-type tricarboxylate transporter receptor subunit TctC